MRGRPQTTNAQKRLRGTDQRCRMRKEAAPAEPLDVNHISADRPVFQTGGITRVEGLTNDRQRKIYEMRCKTLAAMGIMEEAYQEAMILYAFWLDRALDYADKAAKKDVVERYDEYGNLVAFVESPYIRLAEKATRMVNEIGRLFGFSPLTRSNIKTAEKQIDPLAELHKLMGVK